MVQVGWRKCMQISCAKLLSHLDIFSIAKRTKSKNRMQITEFPSRLRQHKRVLREIQGM